MSNIYTSVEARIDRLRLRARHDPRLRREQEELFGERTLAAVEALTFAERDPNAQYAHHSTSHINDEIERQNTILRNFSNGEGEYIPDRRYPAPRPRLRGSILGDRHCR